MERKSLLQFATIIGIGVQNAALNTVFALYGCEFLGLSPRALGILILTFNLSGMVASLLIPALADRHIKPRFALLISILLAALGYVVLATSRNQTIALIATLLCIGPSSSMVGLFFSYARAYHGASPFVVRLRGGFSAAWILGPVVGAALAQYAGYPGFYLSLGAFCVPLAILILALPDAPQLGANSSKVNRAGTGRVAIAFIGMASLQGAAAASITVAPLIVVKSMDGTLTEAGIILGVCAILEVFLLLGSASILSKFQDIHVILFGSACGMLYFMTLWLAPFYWMLLVAQILNATFIVAIKGTGMAWFQGLIPTRPGLSTGLYVNTSKIGAIVAAPCVGFVAASLGSYQQASLVAVTMAIVGVAVVSFSRLVAQDVPQQ